MKRSSTCLGLGGIYRKKRGGSPTYLSGSIHFRGGVDGDEYEIGLSDGLCHISAKKQIPTSTLLHHLV